MKKNLEITPLGGCGEIGMNMTIIQTEGLYYFVDCGILFSDASLPGVDFILPDVAWLKEKKIKPVAWLITHGHEDHIGAMPYLYPQFPAPIYANEFTLEFIQGKFNDHKITKTDMRPWRANQMVNIGNIRVTPYVVNHSIAEAMGLLIETPGGNILHTGDFRIDSKPPEKTMSHDNMAHVIRGKEIKVMLSDSTNSFSVGTDNSEGDLKKAFGDIMKTTEGAVIVTCFASNIWRLQTLFDSAKADGRKVFLLGRSLVRNFEIATRLKFLHASTDDLIPEDQLHRTPRKDICVICTGSQGEEYSGGSRLASGSFHNFKLDESDSFVFSARPIPGNEKSIGALMNQLARMGPRIVTAKEANIHVSGHGYQMDLMECIRTVRPEHFIPVHGEYRHLKKHRELAIEVGVKPEKCFLVENGDKCVISPIGEGVVDKVPNGRTYVCQGSMQSATSEVMRSRAAIAKGGIVFASFVLKKNGFDLAANPAVLNRGVPLDEKSISSQLKRIYQASLENAQKRKDFNEDILKEDLRVRLRQLVEQKTTYKTNIGVLIQRVG